MIGIPIVTRDREIVAAALVHHGLFAAVRCGDRELLASSQRLRENYGEVGVVIFVFLDEG